MTTAKGFANSKYAAWTSWGGIALFALLAGLVLPQLLPGEMVVTRPAAKIDEMDKSDLRYSAPALPDVSNPQPMLARLAAGTVIVLGLCVASLWGMKRFMMPHPSGSSTIRTMRLAESLSLGNRCSLHLVHFGKNQVLVGTDGLGIKSIVPLPTSFEDILTGADVPNDEAPSPEA